MKKYTKEETTNSSDSADVDEEREELRMWARCGACLAACVVKTEVYKKLLRRRSWIFGWLSV